MSHRVVAVLLMVLPAGVAAQVPQRGTAPQRQALLVARGEYLAALGGCNDCHTPKIFRAEMMSLDSSRLLAGYVANPAVPQIPTGVLSPSGARFAIGGTLTLASIAAFISRKPGEAIPQNRAHNDMVRTWRAQTAEIARRNAEHAKGMIGLHVDAPVILTPAASAR